MKAKIINLRRVLAKTLKFPVVAFRAIAKDERHMIRFYFDRHIVKALGLYRFKDTEVQKIAIMVDETASNVIGPSHDAYSGATAAEVASGFAVCIEYLMPQKHIKYLEIGSAKGKSMSFIGSYSLLRDLGFNGVSIDPYFEEAYVEGADQPDRFLGNRNTYVAPINSSSRKEALSLWEQLQLNVDQIRQISKIGLKQLIGDGKKFNLIYIDGLHDGLTPVTDFVSCLELIEDNGIIILDDRHWANVHYLRKMCDNTPLLKKIFENWKISAYVVSVTENTNG